MIYLFYEKPKDIIHLVDYEPHYAQIVFFCEDAEKQDNIVYGNQDHDNIKFLKNVCPICLEQYALYIFK